MAVLVRRNWPQLLTETVLRLGNITSTGFDSRVQYWLAASYFHLCTLYHHVELDDIDTSLSCTTSTNEVTLPSDLFVLVGVRLKAVGGATILGPLLVEEYTLVADKYALESGQPSRCARFGNKLYFDKKPDVAYPLEVFHYRRGLAPDFSGTPTSPELDSDVDEHIIQGALALALPGVGRPDLAAVQRELLAEWLSAQVRSSLGDPLTALPERERTTAISTRQG